MATDALAVELRATLALIAPVVQRLSELLVAQRAAVAGHHLPTLLAVTTEQEEAGARLSGLEQRRQALQISLEVTLGVSGLRAIGERAFADPAERAQYADLVFNIGESVRRLRVESARSTEVISQAAETARRTRMFLARVSGAEPAYTAPMARAGVYSAVTR